MEEKKLVPKRRFEGFEKEWAEIKLGENALIKGRLGWKSLKREEYIDDGPSMIAGRHIRNGKVNWNEVDHIPLWRYEESPEIMLENEDVIFSKDGTLGNPALIKDLEGKATINATMMLIRTNENLNASYFYQILNGKQFLDLVYLKVSGSSIPHLFQGDMEKFIFYAPESREQQKIAEFLNILDERIANQERKITKVKELKEAYLTEMFPQRGEAVPKRRFKEFEGNWETKKLDIIFNDISDGDWIETEHIKNSGKYRIIQTGNLGVGKFLNRSHFAKYINEDSFDILKANEVFPGDILISRLADPAGRSIIVPNIKGKMVTAVDVTIIRGKTLFAKYFIVTQLNSKKILRKVNENVSGTSHKRISRRNLEKILLSIPKDIKEQQKIGQFFKNLDDQIAMEESKLDKLRKMKEAYLEEMFV